MRKSLVIAITGWLALGCGPGTIGGDGEGQPDAGDPGDMGGPGLAGLELDFRISPKLPATVTVSDDGVDTTLDVASAWFILEDVGAIGDAAPGDDRTVAERVDIQGEGDAQTLVAFQQAPPGIYSQVILTVVEYDVVGVTDVGGETVDFEIRDAPPGGLQVAVLVPDLELRAGESASLRVDVKVKELLEEMELHETSPSSNCPNSRPCYVIDGSSSRIGEIRTHMSETFRFHD